MRMDEAVVLKKDGREYVLEHIAAAESLVRFLGEHGLKCEVGEPVMWSGDRPQHVAIEILSSDHAQLSNAVSDWNKREGREPMSAELRAKVSEALLSTATQS